MRPNYIFKRECFWSQVLLLVAGLSGPLEITWRLLSGTRTRGITFRESPSRSPISMYPPATDAGSQMIVFHPSSTISFLHFAKERHTFTWPLSCFVLHLGQRQFEILLLVRRKLFNSDWMIESFLTPMVSKSLLSIKLGGPNQTGSC